MANSFFSRSSRVMFEPKPHAVNESRRTDPRNGVCLNSLYDNAFDRGLVTFSDGLKVVVSPVLRAQSPSQFHQWALLDIEGENLNLPARFAPDPIDWHSIASMPFRVRNGKNSSSSPPSIPVSPVFINIQQWNALPRGRMFVTIMAGIW